MNAFAAVGAALLVSGVHAYVPTTYRALVAGSVGSSFRDVARITEQPMPDLGADEVLIKVVYAGVNGGCETFRARGEFAFASNRELEAFGLGAEGVGIVAAAGPGVDNVEIGDAVCFVGNGFAQYTKATARMLWKVPQATSEMAALRISALTACAMMEITGKVRAGETVLVTAAAGGAGHFAVQFAKLAGCTVIGTCSSPEKARALCSLGCDHIINHRTKDVGEALQRIAPNGVDVAFEGVGGKMLQTVLEHLKEDGRLLQVGYISEYPHNPNRKEETASNELEASSLFWSSKTIKRGKQTIYGNAWPKDFKAVAGCKERVLDLYASGELKALVDEKHTFQGLESVSDAIEYMLSGEAVGKVVVQVGDSE
uniref:Enoyl reductase (ER) domain-containing protein n=1 Tax=Coccolithus braarudii TaxID=221442 RepID=A0A7S0LKP0_9EUKA|mmetsp:Transcript_4553/g.9856  ORF Transcript_4553/g.9856 Transcript_4553/m.9856 type:complete len:370 (+) Transcript_4553:13-1122(+)|eukprot:CAMPEP_0183350714 /NCGR_PEP_ID=MMETSP0164_2-20130417/20734_1 /TAXON_ID=221442 /ORGANISM="Coccolithus pelagicus ssp braarudi, Strain PLY182g" /LENGTH=369 /DNA_ID=CAMNT_0025522691 /DNA_START=13 /DNA_END=1122 /DNA_ORIENTATION=-